MERHKEASVAGTKGSKQERWHDNPERTARNTASKLATKVARRERKQKSKEGWLKRNKEFYQERNKERELK